MYVLNIIILLISLLFLVLHGFTNQFAKYKNLISISTVKNLKSRPFVKTLNNLKRHLITHEEKNLLDLKMEAGFIFRTFVLRDGSEREERYFLDFLHDFCMILQVNEVMKIDREDRRYG